jgi:hypothetical protein
MPCFRIRILALFTNYHLQAIHNFSVISLELFSNILKKYIKCMNDSNMRVATITERMSLTDGLCDAAESIVTPMTYQDMKHGCVYSSNLLRTSGRRGDGRIGEARPAGRRTRLLLRLAAASHRNYIIREFGCLELPNTFLRTSHSEQPAFGNSFQQDAPLHS